MTVFYSSGMWHHVVCWTQESVF